MLKSILKYLFFLAVGVGLFYMASLDITRGKMVLEQGRGSFTVGSGLETNEAGAHKVVVESAAGTEVVIRSETQETFEISTNGRTGSSVFLSEGTYQLETRTMPSPDVSITGVDRTQQLMDDMAKARIPGIVLSFVFGYLAIISRGLRWLIILEPLGYRPSKWRSVNAVAFAYFANTFVPRSGELARCAALNQTDDIPVDKLFGTVISERVVDFIMLFVFMTVAVLGNAPAFTKLVSLSGSGEEASNSALWWLTGMFAVGLVVLVLFRKTLIKLALVQKALQFLKGVLEGLKSVLQMRRKGAFIFHTLFIWVMYFLMAFVIYKSMDGAAHLSVLEAMFVMVAGGFGMVLPAPGGIGSYHWFVKLAFIALGLSGALGFAVANVMWLTQTAMIIITGGLGYLALMVYRIRKDKQLRDYAG